MVFWCPNCAVPCEVVGRGFVARRGAVAAAEPGATLLYLPIWAVGVRWKIRLADESRGRLLRGLPPIQWVYVTGFNLTNASYFGDPGLLYTQRGVRLEAAEASGRRVAGCVRGVEDALAYLEPHLLAIVDRRVDVTDATLLLEVGEAVLWGVPFLDEGETLRDGVLGLSYPAAALMDLDAIRAAQGAP